MMREFDTRNRKCVYTTWPGHEGRSGVRVRRRQEDDRPRRGHRQQLLGPAAVRRRGRAGHDLLLRRAARPGRAGGTDRRAPAVVRRHRRRRVRSRRPAPPCRRRSRTTAPKRFWNEKTGRFGTVDLDGEPARLRVHLPQQRSGLLRLRHARAGTEHSRVDVRRAHRGRTTPPGPRHLSLAVRPAQHDQAQHRLLLLGLVEPRVHPVRLSGAGRRRRCWACRTTT